MHATHTHTHTYTHTYTVSPQFSTQDTSLLLPPYKGNHLVLYWQWFHSTCLRSARRRTRVCATSVCVCLFVCGASLVDLRLHDNIVHFTHTHTHTFTYLYVHTYAHRNLYKHLDTRTYTYSHTYSYAHLHT